MNKVSVYHTGKEKIDSIVDKGFLDFKIDERLEKARIVFIKPNLVTDVHEYIKNGANTDVRVIEAVIKHLSKFKNLKIYLGESDTGTKVKGRKLEIALKYMGVYDLQKKYDFEIMNLTNDMQVKVKIPNAKFLKEVKMSKTFMEADLIIDMPKIKTHKYSTITCALKNMFGSIPDPMRIIYHKDIHKTLADLNLLFYKKMFVVVDGLIGMEGSGPMYGKPVKLDILMFSDNPLATDVAACKIIGIKPNEVKHVKYFSEATKQELDIEVKGDLPIHKFERAHKTWFIWMEEHLMQNKFIVRILFSDFFRKNITYRFRNILKKLRGGSYSWYYKK